MTRPRNSLIFDQQPEHHYVEPAWVTEGLIDRLGDYLPKMVWDPACGFGTIPRVLWDRGFTVRAGDIVDRGAFGVDVADFLTIEPPADPRVDAAIVTNPPFKYAEAFIRHGIRHCRIVAVFVTLKFLAAQTRYNFFLDAPLRHVLVLSRRPSCLPGDRIRMGEKPGGGTADYCWLVFDGAHRGPATMGWLLPRGES